jgi:hypothetical protein
LGFGKVSISTLAILQASTHMQVAELQSKLPGGKPLKQEMKFPKQVKALNLPDPEKNGALYINVTDATKLVMMTQFDPTQPASASEQNPN